MAEQLRLIVEKTDNIIVPRKDGTGTFEMLLINGGGLVFSAIKTKLSNIPAIGDDVIITYQPIKMNNEIRNNILFIQQNEGTMATTKHTEHEHKKEVSQSLNVGKFFKIQGKSLFAHVKEKDTKGKFPTNKYKMDLIVSPNIASKLEARGVLVKTKEGIDGQYVTLKSTYQPTVSDSDGVQLSDIPLLGNGSDLTVTVSLYPNKAPNGGAMCLGMSSIIINDLVQFSAPNLSDLP